MPARYEVADERLREELEKTELRALYLRYELERREFEAEKTVLECLLENFKPAPKPKPSYDQDFYSQEK